ncbi:uncharacterized protein LOC111992133 [Quercus suber]|uniref:uncharacterized protein LOC111992133 n=1 Tax=Quercus suber TaxID=58331 RepID=UPI000D2E26DD|nr:hypothetical protein CFP56_38292 [Quercus suber]
MASQAHLLHIDSEPPLMFLTFSLPTASSYLQSFEQNPTHTKNIILKGKGFPSLLLSQPQAIFKVLNRTPSIPETLSS